MPHHVRPYAGLDLGTLRIFASNIYIGRRFRIKQSVTNFILFRFGSLEKKMYRLLLLAVLFSADAAPAPKPGLVTSLPLYHAPILGVVHAPIVSHVSTLQLPLLHTPVLHTPLLHLPWW
ncbi:unnamed protein product, partial [Iphiclides podalirius]